MILVFETKPVGHQYIPVHNKEKPDCFPHSLRAGGKGASLNCIRQMRSKEKHLETTRKVKKLRCWPERGWIPTLRTA